MLRTPAHTHNGCRVNSIRLDLLLERLDAAIGHAHAQLRQCQCLDHAHPRVPLLPRPRGVLTVLPGCRQPPHPPVPQCPE
jgi:hypothetical protein